MSDLVLPNLTAFVSYCIIRVLTANTEAEFMREFDALFAHNVDVTFNGKHLSREQYRAKLLNMSSAAVGEQAASVSVQGQLEVQGDKGQSVSNICVLLWDSIEEVYSLDLSVFFSLRLFNRSSWSWGCPQRAK